jgi:starch synthase
VNPGVHVPAGRVLSRLGLQPGKFGLAVGRLVAEKGFDDLIEAFAGVTTDMRLLLVGTADHADAYSRALQQAAGKDARIVMAGQLTHAELAEAYSQAAFFVLPSYHEGLPISLMEAMSYGLAVLTSDIPPNLEVTQDARTVFPVGDIACLRQALGELTAGRGDAGQGERGRQRVIDCFSWETIADQTLGFYGRIIAR